MSISPLSFQGTYLIPFSELKGADAHLKMRAIGKETAKFADMKDMQQTKEGILVNIDDKKEKEYEAVIAKYGVNIQKVDTPAVGYGKADVASYKYMVSKLYPNIAEEETQRFEKMPEGDYKSKLYTDMYLKFKNSPYSMETFKELN